MGIMELKPGHYNTFISVCLFGMLYTFGVYHLNYKGDFERSTEPEITFCWEGDSLNQFGFKQNSSFKYLVWDEQKNQHVEVSLDESDGYFFFNNRPNLITWIALFVVFNAFCFGAIAYLIRLLFANKLEFLTYNLKNYSILLVALMIIALVFVMAGGHFLPANHLISPPRLWKLSSVMFHNVSSTLLWLQVPGYVLGLICTAGLLLIGNVEVDKWGDNVEIIRQRLDQLTKRTHHILVILSVLLALTVVTTNFLFKAVFEQIDGPVEALFPSRMLLLYGMVFTFFIVLLYLPSYYKLKSWSEDATKAALEKGADEATFKEQSNKLLNLANPKLLITIASPIITSIFPGLMELIGLTG